MSRVSGHRAASPPTDTETEKCGSIFPGVKGCWPLSRSGGGALVAAGEISARSVKGAALVAVRRRDAGRAEHEIPRPERFRPLSDENFFCEKVRELRAYPLR